MGLLAVVCSPQSFNRDLVRLFRRIFRTSLKGDARNENKTPQSIQCHEVSKMGSPATSPARSDARVQHVGLQFGNGSGKHLRFVSAARECLVMKRKTRPAFFVRLVNRLRSITSEDKKPTRQQPKRHTTGLARRTNGGDACRAGMPLRTEQVASFADICCANPSNCGL
jgi:hypothetical protein